VKVRGALSLLLLLVAPAARAYSGGFLSIPEKPTYLSLGVLFSATGRPSGSTLAAGGEASFHHFFTHTSALLGLGAFTQLQVTDQSHLRFCAGGQLTVLIFGLEAGVAHEGSNARYAATTSLHLAPFISVGYANIGLRVGLPLNSGGPKPTYGSDVGLTVALKYPFGLGRH
jgi:hypothetical protein